MEELSLWVIYLIPLTQMLNRNRELKCCVSLSHVKCISFLFLCLLCTHKFSPCRRNTNTVNILGGAVMTHEWYTTSNPLTRFLEQSEEGQNIWSLFCVLAFSLTLVFFILAKHKLFLVNDIQNNRPEGKAVTIHQ